MSRKTDAIGDYLVNHKLLTRGQLDEALEAQRRSSLPLPQVLVEPPGRPHHHVRPLP